MQLVSAVKMKKAQQAALEGAAYREGLEQSIRKIAPSTDPSLSPLLASPAQNSNKELVIYISSNKGLCGAFNLNLYRYILKNIKMDSADFITVGKKGAVFVSNMRGTLIADYSSAMAVSETSAIFALAVGKFLAGEYRSVTVLYNKFISTLRSELLKEVLLPMKLPVDEGATASAGVYKIEPSPEEIIDALLRSYLEEKIRGALLSSEAVEHSSRMMAMKNATDNANDIIDSLTLLGNRLRQSKITMELLDMITAKESVEGS
ncbi:MAG: hypothetical protein RI947_1493 [Candidatus Parcubacteria bacterium]